jgi:hypothetical protein
MTASTTSDWQLEFGLEREKPSTLFFNVGDVEAAGSAAPQSHALRRAFNLLKLDGILCQDNAPVIYFKEVADIRPEHVAELHRRFWNLGIAPVLVLIAPNDVHVYSGFKRPDPTVTGLPSFGLVCQLNRVADELQSFVLSVESGEFFHRHAKSFDPQQRVDRNLLRDLRVTREKLSEVTTHPDRMAPEVLDALLCRLIFTCYLFDREVIDGGYLKSLGLTGSNHLRDMLRQQPRSKAKTSLYRLFEQLGRDFNGDLFSDDLEAECRQVTEKHLDVVDDFFRGVEVGTGQQRFWPYDFRVIPIETISAIYEHFLKAADAEAKKTSGAFYTPRFLAELVLDTTLSDVPALIEKQFLDPACGSGIFLVGLFNRLADEWNRANPNARYDRRASGLLKILRENLFGVDRNPTACRITAFSLCLAFLDHLSPPDIRELQRKGKMLPKLVRMPGAPQTEDLTGTICCADFFSDEPAIPSRVHFVVGNPPWGSVTDKASPVIRWCDTNKLPFPDKQIATGFVWKAAQHIQEAGKVCFVLPHGTLFNHSDAAVRFQREWLRKHAMESVLNLCDYQYFLFEESRP